MDPGSHKCHNNNFLWGCTFLPEKVDDLLLVVALLKMQAKTTKLTTPTVQISPISPKNWSLALPRRVHSLSGESTYNFPL